MRYSRRLLVALGTLTLAAASLGGCSSTTQVANYDQSFAPTKVDPAAYDILIASATYRPQSGLALGAGDHFGDIAHNEYVAYVRQQVMPIGEYATVPTGGSD